MSNRSASSNCGSWCLHLMRTRRSIAAGTKAPRHLSELMALRIVDVMQYPFAEMFCAADGRDGTGGVHHPAKWGRVMSFEVIWKGNRFELPFCEIVKCPLVEIVPRFVVRREPLGDHSGKEMGFRCRWTVHEPCDANANFALGNRAGTWWHELCSTVLEGDIRGGREHCDDQNTKHCESHDGSRMHFCHFNNSAERARTNMRKGVASKLEKISLKQLPSHTQQTGFKTCEGN